MKLIEGTGPLAVAQIQERLGDLPVIFISAMPGECQPCDPPGVVFAKPLRESELRMAFQQMEVVEWAF